VRFAKRGVIFGLMLGLLVACGDGQSSSGGKVKGLVHDGTLTLATSGNFPPFAFIDSKTGKVTGFSIDLGKAIADRLGLKLATPTIDFVAELQGLSSGRYDMADSGIWPNQERQKTFLFTQPVASTGLIATTLNKNLGRVKGLQDLKGLRVGVIQGSTREQWANENKARLAYKTMRAYPGAAQAVQDLRNGGIDLIIDDPLLALYYIKQNPGVVTTAGQTIESHPLSMAFRKSNTELQTKVNSVLAQLLKDGTVGRLQAKYWNKCIPTPGDIDAQPPYQNPPGCGS
jgi:ABC-type amino acid transport substrate-binding protein